MNLGLHLIQYPSGNWGFVGSVPAKLAWKRKDGKPMADEDWRTIKYCSAPAMFGYIGCSWPTKEDAEKAREGL